MSTSIILLHQNFNANDVDIMVFDSCVLSPRAAAWGEIRHMVHSHYTGKGTSPYFASLLRLGGDCLGSTCLNILQIF